MSGNARLVELLITRGYLKTPRIIQAFQAVDRADFALPEFRQSACADIPLPIGYGQTISQPSTVAYMLELLQPQPGEKILDIGSGSGWTSALLAYLVRTGSPEADGEVSSIEHLSGLWELGKKNLSKYSTVTEPTVKSFCQDGIVNIPQQGPFQKILVSAAAQKEIPTSWRQQLAVNGTILAPVRESLWTFEKRSAAEWIEKEYRGFLFVPLISNNTMKI